MDPSRAAEHDAFESPQRGNGGELLRAATSAPMLLIFGGLLTLGSAVTMGRYLATLPHGAARSQAVLAGDLMAFYTGATMIWQGRGAELYDLHAQQQLQHELRGSEAGGWQPYVNPPLLAVLLAPLSALPFVRCLYVFDALMVAAMILALATLRPLLVAVRRRRATWWAAVLLVVSFHPMIRTMLGGQNTVLTFALLAGVYAALRAGRGALAGLLLGLLTYKPQYTSLALLVLLIRRDFRVLGWAGVGAAAHYGLAATVCGWDWPERMHAAMVVYQPLERAASFHTHIALLPAFDYALARPWSLLLPAAGILWVLVTVGRWATRVRRSDPEFALLWGLVVSGTMLVSPHLQFYDVGVLALPALLAVDYTLRSAAGPSAAARVLLALGYLLYPLYDSGRELGFQPLALWLVLMFWWTARLLQRSAECGPCPRGSFGLRRWNTIAGWLSRTPGRSGTDRPPP